MDWLSTWSVVKAGGFASYILLFISVCLGAFSYGKAVPARIKSVLLSIHQHAGWWGLWFGMLHGAMLTIDRYAPFTWTEVLVPFAASYRNVPTALGILSFYMLLAIMISSDITKRLSRKTWRMIHFLTYPMFVFALIHGLFAGSDTGAAWARNIYATTGILFIDVAILRFFLQRRTKHIGIIASEKSKT